MIKHSKPKSCEVERIEERRSGIEPVKADCIWQLTWFDIGELHLVDIFDILVWVVLLGGFWNDFELFLGWIIERRWKLDERLNN
jgi:hypothetical protein